METSGHSPLSFFIIAEGKRLDSDTNPEKRRKPKSTPRKGHKNIDISRNSGIIRIGLMIRFMTGFKDNLIAKKSRS